MPPATPYAAVLGDREPVAAIREAIDRIDRLVAGWSRDQFERPIGPGKWNPRQILTHLAHAELAFGNRVRMALATPGYIAQPFDQDAWMQREPAWSGREAVDTFLALARMNVGLYAALPGVDRALAFSHPEYGDLTIDWVVHQTAGHLRHHLGQLEAV